MNPYSYKKLSHSDRILLLETYGCFVAERKFYIYNIGLYTLFGFYVEAWRFNNCTEIARTEVQFNEKELDLYLDQISIAELFEV